MSEPTAAPHHPPHNGDAPTDTPEYRDRLLGGALKIALLVGVVGLIAFLVLAGVIFTTVHGPSAEHPGDARWQQVFLSYLTGFTFWMLVGFGSVFFLCIQYVTGGRWGILLRRPLEANAKNIYTLGFLLFIPVAINMAMGENSIYWWARHLAEHGAGHAAAEKSHDLSPENLGQQTLKQSPAAAHVRPRVVTPDLNADEDKKIREWLNPLGLADGNPVGAVPRGFLYIGIFTALVLWLWSNARTAELNADLDAAAAARNRQKYPASVGLFVFALTMTFVATDWLMSLEPTFSSSMFPVIMFDNAAVLAYSVGLLTLLQFKRKGEPRFQHLFPATEQIHLGSLLLAFTLAWTYFNFSQYMLIWIGNLPEEIPYYLKRTRGGWGWYAGLAVVFHFPIPFLLLLFRRIKSSPRALRNIAVMLIVVVFIDVMWWIAPSMDHAEFPKFYWLMDVAATVGVGGLWIAAFLWHLKKYPLLPTREVYLLEAYHHGH